MWYLRKGNGNKGRDYRDLLDINNSFIHNKKIKFSLYVGVSKYVFINLRWFKYVSYNIGLAVHVDE